MTDRSHLTPVQTADKCGRLTTVYRNLTATVLGARSTTGGAGTGRGIPSRPPAAGAQGKPLPTVRERPKAELKAFLCPLTPERYVIGDAVDHIVGESLLERESGRRVASLALEMDMLGSVSAAESKDIILKSARHFGTGRAEDALRIRARLRSEPTILSDHAFYPAIDGLRSRDFNGRRTITTVEGLDAAAAVVACVVSVPEVRKESGVEFAFRTLRVLTIENKHLDRLLWERPGDVDRIIAYARARGVHPKRRHDVDELRAWLDADTPAPGDGLP